MPPSGVATEDNEDDQDHPHVHHLHQRPLNSYHVKQIEMDQRGWAPPAPAAAAGGDFVTSFSDDEGEEELDVRMSRFSNTMNSRYETHSRSKSLMRYNEIERERSRRRQNIVRQKTTSKFSPGTIKLSMMNAGIIPLKKGELMTHAKISVTTQPFNRLIF